MILPTGNLFDKPYGRDSLVIRHVCHYCGGDGFDPNRNRSSGSYEHLKCVTCHGAGHVEQHIKLHDLYEAMKAQIMADAVTEVERRLPEIVERSAMHLVYDIMMS